MDKKVINSRTSLLNFIQGSGVSLFSRQYLHPNLLSPARRQGTVVFYYETQLTGGPFLSSIEKWLAFLILINPCSGDIMNARLGAGDSLLFCPGDPLLLFEPNP